LIIVYGFLATLALIYGLMIRQSLFATFISFHLIVCLGIPLLHGWREGSLPRNWKAAWGDHRGDTAGITVGAVSGMIIAAGVMGGIWLLLRAGVSPERTRVILVSWGLSDDWKWFFAVYMIVVNSFLEELMWRGFVLQRLLSVLPGWGALLLSSFFFALYHLILGVVLFGWKWGIIVTVLVFVTGLFWAWMKRRYPSIYPTWLSHLLADMGVVAALFIWIYP
jgi:membrane protease YdiL (CAAX protease family)